MHVLFIGGTGLISTAIARQLLEAGHQVTLFNRGKSENRLPRRRDTSFTATARTTRRLSRRSRTRPMMSSWTWWPFTRTIRASAIRAFAGRCGQFIHCSTVCVYSGPVTQIPTTETEPYHSLGGYGKNKAICEKLLLQAFADQQFPVTIMRPSHSYGEGGGIIRSVGPGDTFVDRLRKNKPIIVQGDGNSLWASCHVDDVARGFIATMGNTEVPGRSLQHHRRRVVHLEHLPRAGRRSRRRHVPPGPHPHRHPARSRAGPGGRHLRDLRVAVRLRQRQAQARHGLRRPDDHLQGRHPPDAGLAGRERQAAKTATRTITRTA